MKFSQDWFTHNIPSFLDVQKRIGKIESILEVGCFEGRATCWMLENMLSETGTITCVDTFKGGEEHSNLELGSLELQFNENVKEVRKEAQNVETVPLDSYTGLGYLIRNQKLYDFIYIDGSHIAPDVLTDACMAFGMLKKGGIMLFDDYLWRAVPSILHRPKIAIDAFTAIFEERANICILGYQLGIQKI